MPGSRTNSGRRVTVRKGRSSRKVAGRAFGTRKKNRSRSRSRSSRSRCSSRSPGLSRMRAQKKAEKKAKLAQKKICRALSCDPSHDPVTGRKLSKRERKRLKKACGTGCDAAGGSDIGGACDSDSDSDSSVCSSSSSSSCSSSSSDSSCSSSSDSSCCDMSTMDQSGLEYDFSQGHDQSHLQRDSVSTGQNVMSRQTRRNGPMEMPKSVSRRSLKKHRKEVQRLFGLSDDDGEQVLNDRLQQMALGSGVNALQALQFLTGEGTPGQTEDILKYSFKRAQKAVKKCGSSSTKLRHLYEGVMRSQVRRNLWRHLEGTSGGKRARMCPFTGRLAVQGQALWKLVEDAVAKAGRSRRKNKTARPVPRAPTTITGGEEGPQPRDIVEQRQREQRPPQRDLKGRDRSRVDMSDFTFLG